MQKEINSLKKKNHNLIILTKDGLNEKKSKNKKNVNNTVNSPTLLTLKGEDFTIKMNLINTSEINKEKILKTVISMKKHLVDSEGEEINPKNNKNDKKSLNSYFQNENILIESKDSERMSDFDLILKFNGKLNVNKNVSETMKKGSEHTIKQSCRAMICKTNSEIDKFTELDKKNINQIKDISKFGVKSKNECEIIKNNNISVYDNNNINNENNKIKDSSNIFNDSNHCRIISYSNKKNNILNSNIYSITNLENNKNNTNNINLGNDIKLKNNYISSQTSVNDIAKIKNNISQASLPLKNNIKNIYNENENITDNISENKQLISIKKLKKFNNPINVDQNKNIQPIQILNNKDKSSKRESKFSKNNSTNLFEDNNNRIIPAKIDDNRRLKCLICEKVFKENKIFAPRCEKHLMCRKCIKSYYEEIIENNSFILKCPFTKCNEEIDFEILKTIISPIHCEMIITQQKKIMSSAATCSSELINTVEGITDIKSFFKFPFFLEKNCRLNSIKQENSFVLGQTNIKIGIEAGIFSAIVNVVLIGLCSYYVINDKMTVGVLMAVIGVFSTIFAKISGMATLMIPINEARVIFSRMFEFVDMPENCNELVESETSKMINADNLVLDNISFRFVGRKNLFEGLSIGFEKGAITSIVGECGCGKSTLCQLMERFYEPDKGRLLLNGKDASTISLNEWANMIAYVPQEIFLCNGTLLENICFGEEEANYKEIVAFCEKYGFDRFFNELPDGLFTVIGEGGIKLSGGQKQLVAFARALLKPHSIFILDEMTAAMDRKTESFINDLLVKLKKDHIIICVTHRLDTARQVSDNIVVIEDGKVAVKGSHQELMMTDNYYSQYWNGLTNIIR